MIAKRKVFQESYLNTKTVTKKKWFNNESYEGTEIKTFGDVVKDALDFIKSVEHRLISVNECKWEFGWYIAVFYWENE